MILTEEERLEVAIDDMAHWLRMMMSPEDPNATLYHLQSDCPVSFEADTLELGVRVADGLNSEWAYRSEDGLAVHLGILIERAEQDREEVTADFEMVDIAAAILEQAAGSDPDEDAPGDGEFEVNVGMGTMTCGYCGTVASWAEAVLGYWRLTGFYSLGVKFGEADLLVLAEAEAMDGQPVYLPHRCRHIPADIQEQYADEATALAAGDA
jgi:hypothetical protein